MLIHRLTHTANTQQRATDLEHANGSVNGASLPLSDNGRDVRAVTVQLGALHMLGWEDRSAHL